MEIPDNASAQPTGSTAPRANVPKADIISEDGVKLLDTIDKLRQLGIDKDIPLPQIIVVGSQSAGKSSVLEAISDISFPVSDGQCTTFVSEIRLRRAKEETVATNIISKVPGKPGEEIIQPLRGPVDDKSTLEQMPEIIEQAAKIMSEDHGQQFCEDSLRIEVSGRTQHHLSLIDLPGLLHVTKPDQDNAAPGRVKAIVERYMKEKRSIILAVVSARLDYSSQEILEIVKRIDPSGDRTMGIITGVDTRCEGSITEKDYIRLAKNELLKLALGWHVVRNLSDSERKAADSDRNTTEHDFFAKREAWRSVPEEDRGIPELKKKLSRTLLTHIGRELRGVICALDEKINDNESILKQLGEQRSTMREKRGYLNKIGIQYQTLTAAAVRGTYDDEFFKDGNHNLYAKVAKELGAFETAMSNGHRWEFWKLPHDATSTKRTPSIRRQQHEDDPSVPYSVRPVDYLVKVGEILQQYRGQELPGLFDPRLVGILFKDMSCHWEEIATKAIKRIVNIIKRFLESLAKHLVDSRRAQLFLRHNLLPALDAREQTIMTKLEELIKPFQKCNPRTQNQHFLQHVAQYQEEFSGWEIQNSDSEAGPVIENLDACRDLALNMVSYYQIARPTFVDNVGTLGVELCLLDGLDEILAPEKIFDMTDDQVDKIASEFSEDTKKREKAENDLIALRQGRDICREYEQSDDGHASTPEPNPQSPKEQGFTFKFKTPTKIKEASLNVGLQTPPSSTASERISQIRRSETAESEL